MTAPLIILVALAAVAAILFAGLFTMIQTDSARRSQFFMRLRVLMQAAALLLIALAAWLASA